MVDYYRGHYRQHLCQGEDYSILGSGGHVLM